MDTLIVGGGIGGLTLALAMHAANVPGRIRVLEAAPEIKPLGAGINLGPHAMKELSELGLETALSQRGCLPQDYAFFTRHGQLVYREPWGRAAGHQWPIYRFTALICTRCCRPQSPSGWGRRASAPAIAASVSNRTAPALRCTSLGKTVSRSHHSAAIF